MDANGIAIIVGLLLPVLISFVKREHFTQATNGAIAVAVYVVVGIITLLVSGAAITAQSLVVDIGIVTTAGTVAYTAFWKNLEGPPTSF